MAKLFKFSFKNCNNNNDVNTTIYNDNTPIFEYHLDGVVGFLKNPRNSLNSVTLVCMNCIIIQKINIELNELNENLIVFKEDDYVLPENLFKELESIDCAKYNWKYFLNSRYQEFLMVDTSNY
jgi:hypothetical protein